MGRRCGIVHLKRISRLAGTAHLAGATPAGEAARLALSVRTCNTAQEVDTYKTQAVHCP
ncbi:hypothetical protein I603_0060 [Erythrobacter dokdonensis DSW-74]|uniref:Uncharacterized protein n=1 Tax=Erythrobacter dokdonensis DSW-74 TaxID=1300349 RepID=A0A1A7BHH1_9SPHN|nr:hypothetical protein I603_0060 [Erythrobacter dokdonensis DSW-74]